MYWSLKCRKFNDVRKDDIYWWDIPAGKLEDDHESKTKKERPRLRFLRE